jgi:hypothetical protein
MANRDGGAMMIAWKKGVDWAAAVRSVEAYFDGNMDLRFGPNGQNKAHAVIDHLCSGGTVDRSDLMEAE